MRVMKNIILFIILLLAVNLVNAYIYEITYECEDVFCVEEAQTLWSINITNIGSRTIEITSIEFLDSFTKEVFASYKYEGLPTAVYSDAEGGIIIPENTYSVTILNFTLPKMNIENGLLYDLCVDNAVPSFDSYHKELGIFNLRNCYYNHTIPLYQCLHDNHCGPNEYCEYNSCTDLNCSNCQYIKDHKCVDYDCCESYHCEYDEMCFNSTCIELNCEEYQKLENHECIDLNCGDDEIILNEECIKLNCSFDEFGFNYTCKKLECDYDEYIMNHTCISLNCKEEEYAKNHTCLGLNCKQNETFFNHTCNPLKCSFFQKMDNHTCINDIPLIKNLFVEMIVIVLIGTAIVLIISLYEHRHKKKRMEKK